MAVPNPFSRASSGGAHGAQVGWGGGGRTGVLYFTQVRTIDYALIKLYLRSERDDHPRGGDIACDSKRNYYYSGLHYLHVDSLRHAMQIFRVKYPFYPGCSCLGGAGGGGGGGKSQERLLPFRGGRTEMGG